MKKIIKIIIAICAFLVMALMVTAYFTNEAKWIGIRRTGETGDAVIPVEIKNVNNNPVPVNISNYGMKEYTTTIIGNGTNQTDVVFNSLLEHLIIQPDTNEAVWSFKLTDDDSFIIYDGTTSNYTGRLGLIADVPLIGKINLTIQNVTVNGSFNIKIVYT